MEWLNVIKNKLFSIDINSRIKNGSNISRNQFYEQKNKIILSPRSLKDNSFENNNKNNTSYQFENKNNLSTGYDYDYNNHNGSIDNILTCKRFKKDNKILNKMQTNYAKQEKFSDYWKRLRIEKSKSTDELISNDFKKYDESVWEQESSARETAFKVMPFTLHQFSFPEEEIESIINQCMDDFLKK